MDWLSHGVMFGWYAPVLTVIGATGAVRVLQLPPSEDPGWAAAALRLARVLMPLVLIALVARLGLQTWQTFGSDQPLTLASASIVLTETPWGNGWTWQVLASLAAWFLIALTSPAGRGRLLLAAVVLGGTVGMTGHAAGADNDARLLIVVHGLHVIAAGLWLGALAVIVGVTRSSVTTPTPATRAHLASTIDRFSPQAMLAVAVLASSGIVAAWQHVVDVQSILTPYGFVLTAKIVAFGAAALCGLYNWRVVRASLGTHADGAQHLRSMAMLELFFGLVALILTSVLTGMPMPTHE